MSQGKKTSFVKSYAVISLSIIVGTILALSIIFYIYLRKTTYNQVKVASEENINSINNNISARCSVWAALIQYTANAISPFIQSDNVNHEAIESIFMNLVKMQSDVWLVYCTSNNLWYEQGGFAIFSDGELRPHSWDNTARNWYIAAKANPGKVAWAEPFIANNSKLLTISAATNIYSLDDGQCVGVLSGNITTEYLESITKNSAFIDGQQLSIISKDGKYVTHHDPDYVFNRDYFSESGMEQYREQILASQSFSHIDKKIFICSVVIPDLNWILISTIPVKVIFAQTNRFLLRILFLSFGLLATVAVISNLFTHRMLTEERNIYLEQSTIDELTQLKNRRDFSQTFQRRLEHYRSSDDWLCIAIMDIDFFKDYNDHYGHPQGDECLRSIGRVLNSLRESLSIYAARVGGEEFALIWYESNPLNIHNTVAQIQHKINALNIPHEKSKVASHVTISVGIHTVRCGTVKETHILYDLADKALYTAKRNGRNCMIIHDEHKQLDNNEV